MNSFILNRNTSIFYEGIQKPIKCAISILLNDISKCLTDKSEENSIILKKDQSICEEEYCVSINANEITVAYNDELGAIYGLLSLSERYLEIKPFDFWNGIHISPKKNIEIFPCRYYAPKYSVRFRCWFINDEVLLDGWKSNHKDELEMWGKIFETLLRAGGNMVIPGTDRKDEKLAILASDMGLWLTQHHSELLGARMFARVYPDMIPSYSQNPELFEGLWKESIDKFASRKVLWTVGYRGQGDYAFWNIDKTCDTDEKRGTMILRVIKRQMELVREKNPSARFCTNLYGEMMGLYRKGYLNVPDDVIKLWGDNGYGKLVSRRQGNSDPRISSMPLENERGENGLYYHASFYDLQAANHITMSPNSPESIANELEQSLCNGANSCWVINVGSIKPHIYILDLISEIWMNGKVDTNAHARKYALEYYGNESIAHLIMRFSECTAQYGPNADNRTGDQFYHFPLRTIAKKLVRGETEECMRELYWITGDVPFIRQIEKIGLIAASALEGWKKYLSECDLAMETLNEDGKQLLKDTLILQAKLHLTGCKGLSFFYRACLGVKEGRYADAFLYANYALNSHKDGLNALHTAEHGEFENIYRNDCFTNIRLTIRVLDTVRSWLRVCFDGDNFYNWERQYLTPKEDTLVVVLTHRKNQMDDDELFEALDKVVSLD